MSYHAVKDLIIELARPDDSLVEELVEDIDRMFSARRQWEDEVQEIREFVYATDTTTTTNSSNPFANTTTANKLAQIKRNLMTNYRSTLFPNPRWATFRGINDASVTQKVRTVMEHYVRSKLEHSKFESQIAPRFLPDWIETGMAVVRNFYVKEYKKDEGGNPESILYSGARSERINPLNVAYDVTAPTLEAARKVVRSLYSLGELKHMVENDRASFLTPEQYQDLLNRRKDVRSAMQTLGNQEALLNSNLNKAGFGGVLDYYKGNTVEVHQVYGDFYDIENDVLLTNHRITIVDKKTIVEKAAIDSIHGGDYLHIAVFETRGDSLAPISPLARIVGLQYKVDKLENLRADVFDQIANPVTVEIGDVTRQGQPGAPGTKYVAEEGGDVKYLRPDATVLNADMQIMSTMNMMEEFAGAPRQSVGFRTPGEKTKFEVQLLDQGGNKAFLYDVQSLEQQLINPTLNDYLELGQRYMDAQDIIKITDDKTKVETFMSITRDSLTGQGNMIAQGSSSALDKANTLQNLNMLLNQGAVSSMIAPHVSRIKLALALEELADLSEFGLVFQNIGVQEDQETARLAQTATKQTQVNDAIDVQVTDELPEE